MLTQTTNKGLEVEVGETRLYASHNGKRITFIHPYAGPNTYVEVAKQLQKRGLQQPTFGEIVSLVYAASQNPEYKYSSKILKIMKQNLLWCFTGNLYLPKSKDEISNGVIVQDNPGIVNSKVVMDKSQLVEKLKNAQDIDGVLFSSDGTVRFVPFAKEFVKNPYILALTGSEEAREKSSELLKFYSQKPYLWSFESVDEELQEVSALKVRFNSEGLNLVGNEHDSFRYGYAFGVRRAT